MNNIAQVEEVDYTSNLLGNIRAHLQGLQGYDTMALELIQNADDAKAKQIIFDVLDDGLFIWNSGNFSYCGDLKTKPCLHFEDKGENCDFHRITDFGSGGKLSNSDNIGRFGIGFSSTYQISDHPEISSSGLKVKLMPEIGKASSVNQTKEPGTTFFLPWANDPNSSGRNALGISHITPEHIEQLVTDLTDVLQRSLLFLRNVVNAKLRRNGKQIFSCELDRSDNDESELIVSFEPSNEIERWLILRTDIRDNTENIFHKFPKLEILNRQTQITIAIRVEPEPLTSGKLYAFLPTEQSTGLPFHINADFFPEADRKAVIFSGYQQENAWNELLIKATAIELAKDLEGLKDKLGYQQLWSILSSAYDIKKEVDSNHPDCFKCFFDEFYRSMQQGAKVVLTESGQFYSSHNILSPKQHPELSIINILHKLGAQILHEKLRSYQNVLYEFGVKQLTFERYITIIENGIEKLYPKKTIVTADSLKVMFYPIWQFFEALYPKELQADAKDRLKQLNFVLDTELAITSIRDCYAVQKPLTSKKIKKIFNFLPFIHDDISSYNKIFSNVDLFGFNSLVTELEHHLITEEECIEEIIGIENTQLKEFYSVIVELDEVQSEEVHEYIKLSTLEIFKAGDSFVSAKNALLPGNFEDPIGYSKLINTTILDYRSISFIENKLSVKRQSIDEYVRKVVPDFFGSDGPNDIDAYQKLINILAENAGLLNDDEIILLLMELPLLPTQSGDWSIPRNSYFRTDQLASILGENKDLWISEEILPATHSVQNFVNSLGVRKNPSPEHLVEHMINVAEAFKPSSKSRKVCETAFYELCHLYITSEDKENIESILIKLSNVKCFPVDGDFDDWHLANEVYAPYRYQAFQSQAKILDFKNLQKLESEVLKIVGVSIEPETNLIVEHLLECVDKKIPAHFFIYQILNERSKNDYLPIQKLKEKACIYIESKKKYIRPNQLFTLPQKLGKYSYVVPESLNHYKDLFSILGVKDNPDTTDYIDILLDIVDANYPKQKPLKSSDLKIYQNCMEKLVITWSDDKGLISDFDLKRLEPSPVIINILDELHYPYALLIDDSEWYKYLFENDQALCKPEIEYWDFYKQVGVNRLSEVTNINLDYVDLESKKLEREICDLIQDKQSIILRCFHDKTGSFRNKITKVISELSAFSYDVVRIIATTNLGDESISSPSISVKAYFDPDTVSLSIARPIDNNLWLHIFQAIFNPLMLSESSASISNLALAIEPCMRMSLDDANERLTAAGIPLIEDQRDEDFDIDLTSSDFDDLGAENDIGNEYEGVNTSDVLNGKDTDNDVDKKKENDEVKEQKKKRSNNTLDDFRKEIEERRKQEELNNNPEPSDDDKNADTDTDADADAEKNDLDDQSYNSSSNSKENKKSRSKHKKLWDRKLISYVRQRRLNQDEEGNKEDAAYKLSVEAASRELVCQYEIERGREPEEMPQTHPGYDVISRQINSDDIERYIEVKGTSGEWKDRGVSLSRRQFLEAQDNGDKFWLYVVEHAFEKELARVYVIQNPANIVDSFIYDGGWREVVVDENADPKKRFVEGVQIKHDFYGIGRILKVEERGLTTLLHIDFMNGEKNRLPLNLNIMKILEN